MFIFFKNQRSYVSTLFEGYKMGALRNALQRFRRGLPKMDFMNHKHEDCANFDNGHCKVFRFTNLDPKGQACPHFKDKNKEKTENKQK